MDQWARDEIQTETQKNGQRQFCKFAPMSPQRSDFLRCFSFILSPCGTCLVPWTLPGAGGRGLAGGVQMIRERSMDGE